MVGTIVKGAPTTVNVSVTSYFGEDNEVTNNANGKAYGTKFSFNANLQANDHSFAFWIVNGVVRKDITTVDHPFFATENLNLKAIFAPTDKYAVVFMDSNGKLLKVEYVSPNGDATDITEGLPSKPGYQVSTTAKWSGSLTGITGNTVLVLQYEKINDATYAVTVNNGTGSDTYDYNELITVVANAPTEGQYFSHWESSGKVVSRQATYQLTVLKAMTLTAVYTSEQPTTVASIFLENKLDLKEGYFSYQGHFELPEGYEVVEVGVLYSSTLDTFDVDTTSVSRKVIGKYNAENGEFLVSVEKNNTGHLRSYLIYSNVSTGQISTVYSDIVTTNPNDLFISEYGEGGSNNKWIEIYNPTNGTIDLSNYSLKLYTNGSGTASNPLSLSGTLASKSTYVVYNSAAVTDISSKGQIAASVTYFNGDDAVTLEKNGEIVDIIGMVGTDPGTAWTWDDGSTLDMTLVRKFGIYYPNSTWTTSEWDAYPQDTFAYIGSHQTTEIMPITITVSGDTRVLETKTIQLSSSVSPSGAVPTVDWSSSNESIATVSSTGEVTGVAAGTVTITATSVKDSNVYDEHIIIVTEPNYFDINVGSNDDSYGTVSTNNPSVIEGGSVNITLTPATGYRLVSHTINSETTTYENQTSTLTITINDITSNQTVSGLFEEIPTGTMTEQYVFNFGTDNKTGYALGTVTFDNNDGISYTLNKNRAQINTLSGYTPALILAPIKGYLVAYVEIDLTSVSYNVEEISFKYTAWSSSAITNIKDTTKATNPVFVLQYYNTNTSVWETLTSKTLISNLVNTVTTSYQEIVYTVSGKGKYRLLVQMDSATSATNTNYAMVVDDFSIRAMSE